MLSSQIVRKSPIQVGTLLEPFTLFRTSSINSHFMTFTLKALSSHGLISKPRRFKVDLIVFLPPPCWASLFPQGSMRHLDDLGSDHRAIARFHSVSRDSPRQYFSYDVRWNRNEEVCNIVSSFWKALLLASCPLLLRACPQDDECIIPLFL
ncbi:hypothetical protein LINPERPRIM_LOCUS11024 [Linum perenne]